MEVQDFFVSQRSLSFSLMRFHAGHLGFSRADSWKDLLHFPHVSAFILNFSIAARKRHIQIFTHAHRCIKKWRLVWVFGKNETSQRRLGALVGGNGSSGGSIIINMAFLKKHDVSLRLCEWWEHLSGQMFLFCPSYKHCDAGLEIRQRWTKQLERKCACCKCCLNKCFVLFFSKISLDSKKVYGNGLKGDNV